MKKTNERQHSRWLFLLLLYLLWQGAMTASAAKKAWVKYDESTTTLTFYYTDKDQLGTNEYDVNKGSVPTAWSQQREKITKVVFDASFAEARPTTCYMWFYNGTNITAIEGIENLNTSAVTNMSYMFYGCSKLEHVDLSKFDTSNVTDMDLMFCGCSALTQLDLTNFNTAKVTEMSQMFQNCSALTRLDLSHFDTSSVTTMDFMFYGCSALTQLDLSSFNTANVTNMRYMFHQCSALTQLDLTNFDTSNVTTMESMFSFCKSLQTLDLTSFDTGNVTNMTNMFNACHALEQICASDKFTTAKVEADYPLFGSNSKLKGDIAYDGQKEGKAYATINGGYFIDKQYIRPWVSKANGTLTFQQSYKKTFATTGEYELNTIGSNPGWNGRSVTKVVFDPSFAQARPTTCRMWFYGGRDISTIEGIEYLNTSAVADMSWMFFECLNLKQLDLSHFDTSNVTDMSSMFSYCQSLTSLDLSSFNTANVTNMDEMFNSCSQLKEIWATDKFTTDKVSTSLSMFYNCTSLKGDMPYDESKIGHTYATTDNGYLQDKQYVHPWVSFANGTLTFQNTYKKTLAQEGEYELNTLNEDGISTTPGWHNDLGNTVKVVFAPSFAQVRPTTCYQWFYCEGETGSAITTIEGIEYLNTSEATNMAGMFRNCQELTELDLSHFDTSNVTDMHNMFYDCVKIKELDLTSFNTANVTNMSEMFDGCHSLLNLNLSSFNTANVTDMGYMFHDCWSLTQLNVSSFNTSNVIDMRYMFYGCAQLQTLDITNFSSDKAENDGSMFSYCRNLKSLYLGPKYKKRVTSATQVSEGMTTIVYCQPLQYAEVQKAFSTQTVKPYVPINARSEYGTICIPLGSKLTADTYTGFDKLYTVKAADTAKGTITLAEATSIEPGVAYVYHRNLAPDAEKSIITFEADNNATTATAPVNNGSLLKGTFSRITAPGGSYILQTDGNFHPVAADNTTLGVGAYRAYLSLPGLDNDGGYSNALRMVFGDATAIDNANTDKASQPKAYFDLSGRKVAHPQKGSIYINNGRKIVY